MLAGDEFYIKEWPQLEGRTFAEVLVSFEEAIPLGVRRPDGALMINPLDSYVMQPGAFFWHLPCFFTLQKLLVDRAFRALPSCLHLHATAQDNMFTGPSLPPDLAWCLHMHGSKAGRLPTD